jgi:hypothetical protein
MGRDSLFHDLAAFLRLKDLLGGRQTRSTFIATSFLAAVIAGCDPGS